MVYASNLLSGLSIFYRSFWPSLPADKLALGFLDLFQKGVGGRASGRQLASLNYRMTYLIRLAPECLIHLFKGQGPDLTHFHTGRNQALILTLLTVVTLECHVLVGRGREVLVKTQHSERTSHGAGRTVDTYVRIDKDMLSVFIPEDGTWQAGR